MNRIYNIQILDSTVNPVSWYQYSDEILFSFELETDSGEKKLCKTNGYTIKSDNYEHIPAEHYALWLSQIIDYINDHNERLLSNTLTDVDLQYKIIDVNEDYAYKYEKYINGKLISTGYGWYSNLNYKIEKDAWKKGVKEYKKAKRIKLRSDILEEKKKEILDYIRALDDHLEQESETEPPLIPTALAKMKDDPCEFISDIIRKGCQGSTGLSLKELANYYIKTLKYNARVKVTNAVESQTAMVETAVESLFETVTPMYDYFDDMDARAEEFQKQHSETVALFNMTVYNIPRNTDSQSYYTATDYIYSGDGNTEVITEQNKISKTVYSQLGKNPTKATVDANITWFKVITRDRNGQAVERYVAFHKMAKGTVQAMFKEIYETTNFKILSLGSYCYRNVSGTDKLSNHAFGLALDLNYEWNPYLHPTNGTKGRSDCKNYDNDIEIRTGNHPIVQILKKYGFGWGGYYNCGPDYMHFSCDTAINSKGQLVGK